MISENSSKAINLFHYGSHNNNPNKPGKTCAISAILIKEVIGCKLWTCRTHQNTVAQQTIFSRNLDKIIFVLFSYFDSFSKQIQQIVGFKWLLLYPMSPLFCLSRNRQNMHRYLFIYVCVNSISTSYGMKCVESLFLLNEYSLLYLRAFIPRISLNKHLPMNLFDTFNTWSLYSFQHYLNWNKEVLNHSLNCVTQLSNDFLRTSE